MQYAKTFWLTWDDYSIQSVLFEHIDENAEKEEIVRNKPVNGVRKYSATNEVQQPPPQTPPKVNILLVSTRECLDLCVILS